jgi:hypothetical protein
MRDDFLPAVQWHVARLSIIASAARGQGVAGVVEAARSYVATLPLAPFGADSERAFQQHLDDATAQLRRRLPHGARSWGVSRKLLNIFLRNALYNGYLNQAYRLHNAETWFEVPLDSLVAKELERRYLPARLTPWKGVKHATPKLSREYQQAIRRLAQSEGIAPVHLDTYWWGGSRQAVV